jgi:hypothetical protein
MLALPFHTLLGMSLESQTTPIAPGISLTDLHTGGGLMWVAGEATGLLCTLAVFIAWLRTDERAARRNDRVAEAAAAAQLAHWRATRDAAARAAGAGWPASASAPGTAGIRNAAAPHPPARTAGTSDVPAPHTSARTAGIRNAAARNDAVPDGARPPSGITQPVISAGSAGPAAPANS